MGAKDFMEEHRPHGKLHLVHADYEPKIHYWLCGKCKTFEENECLCPEREVTMLEMVKRKLRQT